VTPVAIVPSPLIRRDESVYLSGRDEVRLLDLKTFESKTIARDEIWAFQSSDPGFSPDGRYICYTAHRNFEEDIFIYDLTKGTSINLTNTGVAESGPVWAPDGKYIYFTSARLRPSYPFGMRDPKVYRLPWKNSTSPSGWINTTSCSNRRKRTALRKTVPKRTAPKRYIARTTEHRRPPDHGTHRTGGPSFGDQYLVDLIQKEEKTNVLFTSNQDQGKTALWKTVIEPFEQNKTEKITGAEGRNISVAFCRRQILRAA